MSANDDEVYVRINTKGYMPEVQAVGPIKCTFVKKNVYAEMIRLKRDVCLLNSASCVAFAAKMKAYAEAIAKDDFDASSKILAKSEKEFIVTTTSTNNTTKINTVKTNEADTVLKTATKTAAVVEKTKND